MNLQLLEEIHQQNPWVTKREFPIQNIANFKPRQQFSTQWDALCTLLRQMALLI